MQPDLRGRKAKLRGVYAGLQRHTAALRMPQAEDTTTCLQCGSKRPASVDTCATCEAKATNAGDKDLSWRAFAAIGAPFLLIDATRDFLTFPTDSAKAQGAICATVMLSMGIAWLIYRLFKTRYLLTWVLTYSVFVLIHLVSTLAVEKPPLDVPPPPPPPKVTEAPVQKAVGHGAVRPLVAPWPRGWGAMPTVKMPGVDGVVDAAVLREGNAPVAAISLSHWRDANQGSLTDNAQRLIRSETDTAKAKGTTLTVSPLSATSVRARPALQFDVSLAHGGKIKRERHTIIEGSNHAFCAISFVAAEENFDKHRPAFENMRNQLTCP